MPLELLNGIWVPVEAPLPDSGSEMYLNAIKTLALRTTALEAIAGLSEAGGNQYKANNKSGLTLLAGTPVSATGAGFIRADKDSLSTLCVGLIQANTVNDAEGTVQTGGPIQLADWSSVLAEGVAGLTLNATYFIGDDGQLVREGDGVGLPVTGFLQSVGKAVRSDILVIEIEDPIEL